MQVRAVLTTVIVTLLLAGLFTGCGSKYDDTLIPPMREVEAMTELIDQEVALSPDQRTKVREIISDNWLMAQRIHDQYAGRPIELKEHEKSRLKKLNRQMEGVLNDQQFEAWQPLYREIYEREMDAYGDPRFKNQQQFNPDYPRTGGYGY